MKLKLGETVLAHVPDELASNVIQRFQRPGEITGCGFVENVWNNGQELATWIVPPDGERESDDPLGSWKDSDESIIRPMEAAPKDRPILVYVPEDETWGGFCVVKWCNKLDVWRPYFAHRFLKNSKNGVIEIDDAIFWISLANNNEAR